MTTTNPPPAHPPTVDEPFGQRGIRAHAGALLVALLLIGALCSGALWYRSMDRRDHLTFRNPDANLHIESIWGRLLIWKEPLPPGGPRFRSSWSMGGGYVDPSRIGDGWDPSIWKTVGIEMRMESLRGPSGGWWIRVKWYFVVVLMLIFPACKLVSLFWRRGDADE